MDTTKLTAAVLGWKLVGSSKPCVHCSLGKTKKQKLPKTVSTKHQLQKGELRTGIDLSKGPRTSYGGNSYWLLIVSMMKEHDKCWSKFMKQKSDVCKSMMNFINHVEANKIKAKALRLDNAGENCKLVDRLK